MQVTERVLPAAIHLCSGSACQFLVLRDRNPCMYEALKDVFPVVPLDGVSLIAQNYVAACNCKSSQAARIVDETSVQIEEARVQAYSQEYHICHSPLCQTHLNMKHLLSRSIARILGRSEQLLMSAGPRCDSYSYQEGLPPSWPRSSSEVVKLTL